MCFDIMDFNLDSLVKKYNCSDYISGKYSIGYYDEATFLQVILPISEAFVSNTDQHLVIGYAGADGIEFCYRDNTMGIWAYYPYENNYELISKDIFDLASGWVNGNICV